MISGAPREPRIKSDNRRLAERHIYSNLLQTFLHMEMDSLSEDEQRKLAAKRPDLMSAFGNASDFFVEGGDFIFVAFQAWMISAVLPEKSAVAEGIAAWLPD